MDNDLNLTDLPPEVEQAIADHREWCRALFQRTLTGIPDIMFTQLGAQRDPK